MQQILMDECNPSLDILDGESIPHGVQTSPVAMEEDVPLMVGSHDSGRGTSVTRYDDGTEKRYWEDTHKERSKNKKFIEAAIARLRRARANPRRIHVPKDAWPGGVSALPRKANGGRSVHPRLIIVSIADVVVVAVIVVWQRKAGGEGCDRDGGGRGV
uniref:Uncharacterized protein n=1 Tax=Oryza barthii TaxID=65489 RepID=A0A0D3FIT6_9ORYZ